jgi:hypothetical protein
MIQNFVANTGSMSVRYDNSQGLTIQSYNNPVITIPPTEAKDLHDFLKLLYRSDTIAPP